MTKEADKQAAYIPSSSKGMRQGDPGFTPVLKSLRDDFERTSWTTDPGTTGTRNYPSMYELARSLTKGKWGKGGQWQ